MVYSHTVDSEGSATFSAETEDQLQMRLVQLLNLPQAAPDPWTPEEEEEARAGEGGNFLSLNVTQLAESLKNLPTHARLALPAELLQHYGVSEDLAFTASEATEHTDSTTPPPSHPSTSQVPPPQATRGSGIDLKSLLSKNSTAKHTFDFSTPNKKEAEGDPQSHSHTVADKDLEDLLKTSSHLPTSHKAPTPQSWPPTAHSQPDKISGVIESLAAHQSNAVTEELDSILDDLLA